MELTASEPFQCFDTIENMLGVDMSKPTWTAEGGETLRFHEDKAAEGSGTVHATRKAWRAEYCGPAYIGDGPLDDLPRIQIGSASSENRPSGEKGYVTREDLDADITANGIFVSYGNYLIPNGAETLLKSRDVSKKTVFQQKADALYLGIWQQPYYGCGIDMGRPGGYLDRLDPRTGVPCSGGKDPHSPDYDDMVCKDDRRAMTAFWPGDLVDPGRIGKTESTSTLELSKLLNWTTSDTRRSNRFTGTPWDATELPTGVLHVPEARAGHGFRRPSKARVVTDKMDELSGKMSCDSWALDTYTRLEGTSVDDVGSIRWQLMWAMDASLLNAAQVKQSMEWGTSARRSRPPRSSLADAWSGSFEGGPKQWAKDNEKQYTKVLEVCAKRLAWFAHGYHDRSQGRRVRSNPCPRTFSSSIGRTFVNAENQPATVAMDYFFPHPNNKVVGTSYVANEGLNHKSGMTMEGMKKVFCPALSSTGESVWDCKDTEDPTCVSSSSYFDPKWQVVNSPQNTPQPLSAGYSTALVQPFDVMDKAPHSAIFSAQATWRTGTFSGQKGCKELCISSACQAKQCKQDPDAERPGVNVQPVVREEGLKVHNFWQYDDSIVRVEESASSDAPIWEFDLTAAEGMHPRADMFDGYLGGFSPLDYRDSRVHTEMQNAGGGAFPGADSGCHNGECTENPNGKYDYYMRDFMEDYEFFARTPTARQNDKTGTLDTAREFCREHLFDGWDSRLAKPPPKVPEPREGEKKTFASPFYNVFKPPAAGGPKVNFISPNRPLSALSVVNVTSLSVDGDSEPVSRQFRAKQMFHRPNDGSWAYYLDAGTLSSKIANQGSSNTANAGMLKNVLKVPETFKRPSFYSGLVVELVNTELSSELSSNAIARQSLYRDIERSMSHLPDQWACARQVDVPLLAERVNDQKMEANWSNGELWNETEQLHTFTGAVSGFDNIVASGISLENPAHPFTAASGSSVAHQNHLTAEGIDIATTICMRRFFAWVGLVMSGETVSTSVDFDGVQIGLLPVQVCCLFLLFVFVFGCPGRVFG